MTTFEALTVLARTFGLFWMMGVFVIVVVLAYRPGARDRHDRAARSILGQHEPEGGAR